MTSVRPVALVFAVLAVACGREPPPVPRAVGTVIVDPPLDPATEAEVMRSRGVEERVEARLGLDAAAAASLRPRVRTRVVRDSRIVELAVAVTPQAGGAVTALDEQATIALCNQWLDSYVEQTMTQQIQAGGSARRMPLRVLDTCRVRRR